MKDKGSKVEDLKFKKAIMRPLKRILKFFRKIFKKVRRVIKNCYASFMTLSAKARYIMGVWICVAVLILILIVISQSNQKYLTTYTQIESDISKAAISYVEDKEIYAVANNKLKLQIEVLESMNYLYEDKITDDTCDGYALVYYDQDTEEYLSDSYIACAKYKTKGYEDD